MVRTITNKYCVIENVLDEHEIDIYYKEFISWQHSIPKHDYFVSKMTTHGIYKHHYAGNTRHAWMIRTNKKIFFHKYGIQLIWYHRWMDVVIIHQ